jgi:hypothetical protein
MLLRCSSSAFLAASFELEHEVAKMASPGSKARYKRKDKNRRLFITRFLQERESYFKQAGSARPSKYGDRAWEYI